MILPDSARDLVTSGKLATCITLNADGSPQLSAVWVGLEDDSTVQMAHIPHHRKVRNLQRDPRVWLALQGEERNEIGMQHYLTIRGTATVTAGGTADVLRRLARIYNGPQAEFPVPADAPPGWVVHIAVERVGGFGPWAQ